MEHDVSCKKVFGMTLCKFKSGYQVMLPTKNHKIPIIIYSSKKVNRDPNLKKRIDKINRKLSKPFIVKEYDVEHHPTPNSVMTIPTILVGNEVITDVNFTASTLIRKASLFSF